MGLAVAVGVATAAWFPIIPEDMERTTVTSPSIIPRPARLTMGRGSFRLDASTVIVVDETEPVVRRVADEVRRMLRQAVDIPLPVVFSAKEPLPPNHIVLRLGDTAEAPGDEDYALRVASGGVTLAASTAQGVFYGLQSLRQLIELPPDATSSLSEATLPCVTILDGPRYRWRGMLLDCGRHFMTTEFIKRTIDLLAYHKMNVFHWHLTEDQGWRIAIERYPELTRIGAWRGEGAARYGGFYTRDDVREIVAHARSRHVMVVPEIELPGHSLAALASYPELGCAGTGYRVGTRWGVYDDVYCAGNEQVFTFLEHVLTEVIELFPAPYIHIGGDECPKTAWANCPKCQQRIRDEGLEDEHELQSYFIRRIETFLNGKGRRLIGWDEILEGGLAPNATVQSWRGMGGAIAAARAGHDVISSPTSHCYLDYAQVRAEGHPTQMGYLPLERVYAFEPTPAELTPAQRAHVLGLEGNMWTEHAPQEVVDRQVFPRLCALAEVAWTPRDRRDYADFSQRMAAHYRRLDALGVTYFVPPPSSPSDRVFEEAQTVVLQNPLARGTIRYTLDGRAPTDQSSTYTHPLRLNETTTIKAVTQGANGRRSAVAELRFRKLVPLEPADVAGVQPGVEYAYYEGRWDRLPTFNDLTPVATGRCPTFDLSIRQRDDAFAVQFQGYLEVPVDGIYRLTLTSDDGSRLWIGDELVVDHDGLHSASAVSGQVILKAGRHPITVAHFEAGGGEALTVSWSGPDITEQPIPAAALWRAVAE